MADVASRELRNNTRKVLDRVAAGEDMRITVDGRVVAILTPAPRRPTWMPAEEFAARLEGNQADAGLRQFLDELVPDTTDDLPW